ncbi:rRNA adenine N-6-methyltransferase family protein [Solwaraspora sp. WMMD937]|uniref:rRNA adenine N-6-methyltransferase family protein n=1 Tax=Solwaraspora sp. WMMD937 TaxID=3016090 RepID=UPI002499FEA0|nr:rRNA adenine N-6-methyltransferase family protein [Solwaraspora sp. WMMD937]WFE23132.1 rRNA adenine N-6-methyltransferase family protein [Solwaraspora sp. WMMD937]
MDRSLITDLTDLVARTEGPIVEIGAGDGALTLPLSRQDRKVTAVEIDPKRQAVGPTDPRERHRGLRRHPALPASPEPPT